MGASLAACTGVIFAACAETWVGGGSAISTFFYAMLWTHLARRRPSGFFGKWGFAWPLAALNAGTAMVILWLIDHESADLRDLLWAFTVGTTLGLLVWGPALIAALFLFWIPFSRALNGAERGMGPADRGEQSFALIAFAWSSLATIGSCFLRVEPAYEPHGTAWQLALTVLGMLGVLAAATTAIHAQGRIAMRRAFLADVTAGRAEGYRIDPGEVRPVLVRIAPATSDAYRAPSFADPIAELDEEGDAQRAIELR